MLAATLTTLDGIDDAVKPFYAEADGKFVLQIDGIDSHPTVAPLKNAYERTKTDRETAKAEAATLKAQIAELQKGAPDTAATQAKLADLQAKLDAANATNGELTGKLTGVTRDRALSDALTAAGVTNPAFVKAAQAMLGSKVKIEGDVMLVETGMGPKMLDTYIKEWAAGDGKDFVSKPAGGGAQGNQGGSASATKTMTRSDYDALPPAKQREAMIGGTTLTD